MIHHTEREAEFSEQGLCCLLVRDPSVVKESAWYAAGSWDSCWPGKEDKVLVIQENLSSQEGRKLSRCVLLPGVCGDGRGTDAMLAWWRGLRDHLSYFLPRKME